MKNFAQLFLCFFLIFCAACNNQETFYLDFENEVSQFESASLIIKAIDAVTGTEISGVTISVAGQQSSTNEFGLSFFEGLEVTANKLKVSATYSGYAPAFSNVTVNRKNCLAEIALVPIQSVNFNSSNQQFIDIGNSGAQVIFPANAFVMQNGAAYNGTVKVEMAYIQPNQANFGQSMPGSDFMGLNNNGDERFLVSYGAVSIELFGQNGEELQLTEGKQATLRMPVPENTFEKPSQIPMWYFDEEQQIWIEEGVATLNGNEYVSKVSHFSWWNCDDPVDPKTFVQGTIVDCDGNPVVGLQVKIGPLTVYTDDNGFFQSNVAPDLTFTVSFYDYVNMYISIPIQGVPKNEIHDLGIIAPSDEILCILVASVTFEFFDCNNEPIEPLYYCADLIPAFGSFQTSANVFQFFEQTELDILLLSNYDTLLQVVIDTLQETQNFEFVLCNNNSEPTDTTTVEGPNNNGCCNADLTLDDLEISIDSIANSFCEINFVNDSIFYLTMLNPTNAEIPFSFSLYSTTNITIGESYPLGKSIGFAATFSTKSFLTETGMITFTEIDENNVSFTITASGNDCNATNINCIDIYNENNVEQAANLIAFQYLVNINPTFDSVNNFINGNSFTEFSTELNASFCITN